jgi:hypothetical protein
MKTIKEQIIEIISEEQVDWDITLRRWNEYWSLAGYIIWYNYFTRLEGHDWRIDVCRDILKFTDGLDNKTYDIPNKASYLYSEQENKDLLKILKKIQKAEEILRKKINKWSDLK